MGLYKSIFESEEATASIQKMIQEGAVIIDVRTPGEFNAGHVSGSKNIPLQIIDKEVEAIKKIAQPIVLCCLSGNRSGQAAQFLKGHGIECENGGGWAHVNHLV